MAHKIHLVSFALCMFAAVILSVIVAPPTYAQTEDCRDDFYIEQYIADYSKCATPPTPSCAIALTSTPTGGSNAEIAFKFLLTKGLTAKQAAGVVGNLMQESGGGTFDINPKIENAIGAYGIVQWLGARKTSLFKFAASQTKPPSDLGVQLDFMWIELTGPYKKSVLDPLKASTDLSTATNIILQKYEIPCIGSKECEPYLKARLTYATKALEAFAGMSPEEIASTDVVNPACNSGTAGGSTTGTVDPSGYAFPIVLPKSLVSNGFGWPCRTSYPYCHWNNTAAFDLSKKPSNNTTGVPIVAIYPGKIIKIGMDYMGTGCQSIQYRGDDGHNYWYGHIRTDSNTPKLLQPITAGRYLGKVGESKCTGNGSYPHLHIDRARKGLTAGITENRDATFIPIMNTLYNNLPETP